MPVEHLVEGGEQPVGRRGEAAHALDRLGDQRGDVARGLAEHVLQVGDAGRDVVVVAQVGERAAGAHPAVHVQRLQRARGWSATSPRLPVMPMAEKDRPW